jgi:hypothetical protein
MNRAATSSRPEDIFVDLFSQVSESKRLSSSRSNLNTPTSTRAAALLPSRSRPSGPGSARILRAPPQIPQDFHHYRQDKISVVQCEDDLLRQNSLIYDGWRVFRWTDRQLADEPERVKEQLALFLASIPAYMSWTISFLSSAEASLNSAATWLATEGLDKAVGIVGASLAIVEITAICIGRVA